MGAHAKEPRRATDVARRRSSQHTGALALIALLLAIGVGLLHAGHASADCVIQNHVPKCCTPDGVCGPSVPGVPPAVDNEAPDVTQYPTAVPADPAPPDQPLPGGAASTDDASPYTTVLAGAAPHVQAQAMKNGLLPLPTTAAAGFTHGVCRGKFTFHNKPAQRSGYSLYWGHEVKCYNTGEVLFGQGQAVLQTPAGSTDQAGVNYAGHVGTFGTSNNVYSEAKRYSHQIDWHGSQTLLNGDDWVVVPLQCFGQFTSTISCHFTSPVFR